MESRRHTPSALTDADPRAVGPIALTGRLGAGGMSTVYQGELPGHGLVAVKVVAPHLSDDPEYRRRLDREVDALGRVHSGRVAALIAADTGADPPWLAMDYLAGPTLHERVRGSGPMPTDAVVSVAAELAEGLTALHAVGVVHRDLTPANVILTERGAVIVDLGIARLGGAAPLTRTGTTIGTPAWMAPEQLTGGPVGPATDVFAWAGVVTFAATGRAAFGDGDPAALGYRIVHGAPALDGVAAELRPALTAALAQDPAHRPDASSLMGMLAGEPAPTRITPEPRSETPVAATMASTRIARNRATSSPSLSPPNRGPRRGPYWPWVVLAVIVGITMILVIALFV